MLTTQGFQNGNDSVTDDDKHADGLEGLDGVEGTKCEEGAVASLESLDIRANKVAGAPAAQMVIDRLPTISQHQCSSEETELNANNENNIATSASGVRKRGKRKKRVNTLLTSEYETHVSSFFIRGFLRGAIQKGHDVDAIMRRARIDPAMYADRKARITGEQLQRLVLAIREAMDDHYMGFLKVRGKLAMDLHSGLSALQGETLGQGIREVNEFINAVRNDEVHHFFVPLDGEEATLTYEFSDFARGVNPHLLYLFRMYWGYRFFCWLVGQQIKLKRVCFTAARPRYHFDYESGFDCEVLFEQAENSMTFSQGCLVLPILRNKTALLDGDYPKDFPDWFSIPGHDKSCAGQVEQILIELRDQGIFAPSIEMVAKMMRMGRRTLSRKLSKEKMSFQEIRTRVRRDYARNFLIGSDFSITDIAIKVGFAEPSDFTRAFQRWEGITPSEFRDIRFRGNV